MSLREDRKLLFAAEYNSYSPESRPGSPRWMENKRARVALAAFDAAHPEIIEAIRAEKKAADEAAYESLSDFAKSGG